jgi:hypothetical protein
VNGKNLFACFLGAFLVLVFVDEALAGGARIRLAAEERFQWRGQVDGVDEILIHGGSVLVRHLAAKPIQRQDHRFTSPLPEWDVDLDLYKIEGRGDVELIEEPSSWNEYTATVRIDDSDEIGDGYYEFELRWNDRDEWGGWGGGNDRDPWSDDDDVWGQDEQDEPDEDDDWYRDWDGEGGAFRWEGRVDIEALIRIRGGEHQVEGAGGSGTQEYRNRFTSDLPEAEIPVSLRQLEGRGRVELIQTPAADNDYTAVVRIEDSGSGDDTYEFELTW